MIQDIVILGAGGFAREVSFLIEEINRKSPTWRLLGFVEAEKDRVGAPVGKYSVVCTDDDLSGMKVAVAIGMGSPKIICNVVERLKNYSNIFFPNLIHPETIWDRERVSLGQGNIVCAGNIFTTDIQIGSYNCFNLSCTYGHDIEIGDCCVFNPGINISGGVKVLDGCLIGSGATVLQYLNIGEGAVVGAGAVVTKNVAPNTIVAGVPAQILQKSKPVS